MTIRPEQVINENAERILELLQRMGHGKTVRVTSGGLADNEPYEGRITFSIVRGPAILAKTANGRRMSTPITTSGFAPTRTGESVAYVQITGQVVRFEYRTTRGRGWRQFEFDA